MRKKFVLNCWYVAAWKSEIQNEPFARTILNKPIVFYRKKNGKVVALDDQCSHRAAPLSLGKVIEDEIQCGYHGFKFNCQGVCTWIPGQKVIPNNTKIKSYPIIEKWRWIWIWLGDPELADEKLIPNFWWNDHPNWAVMEGPYYNFKGNYQLVVDNLLDGSHVSFLHSSTLGTDAVADIPTKTKSDKLNVRSERWIIDKPPAPMYQRIGNFKGNVDRWQLIDFVPPSNVVLDTGSCDTGQGKDNGFNLVPINSMTPENDDSTHVFWSHTRNFDLHSLDTSNLIRKQMTTAWNEDIFMMEQQQKRISKSNKPFISVKIDNAPERARKIVESLICEEEKNDSLKCPIKERIKSGNLFGVTT